MGGCGLSDAYSGQIMTHLFNPSDLQRARALCVVVAAVQGLLV
jgi:hypothetical protein